MTPTAIIKRSFLGALLLLWSCGDKPAAPPAPEPTAQPVPADSRAAPEVKADTEGKAGMIVGKVSYKGDPKARTLSLGKDQEVCGKSKTDPTLSVGEGGGLRNAVVHITDIKTGKKYEPQKVTLDQKGCEYQPHVLAFVAGSTVEVLNPDGILHNVRALSKVNTPFNLAQPKFKTSLTVKFDQPEIVAVRCDVHDWMSGWFFVAEHPYFSVSDASGAFALPSVPPGGYTVEVWHEKLDTQNKKIEVAADGKVEVNFEFAAPGA